MKHTFAGKIVALATLLTLVFSAVGTAPAQAAGVYTHTWFVRRTIERLVDFDNKNADVDYSELVNILNWWGGYVNYGSIFPDITYVIDSTWAEYLHDTTPVDVRNNYSNYLVFLDNNYPDDLTSKDIESQTKHYKEFLDNSSEAVLPKFRAALMSEMMVHFENNNRTVNDEKMIAFLFGFIAHQEADIFWHFNYDTCNDPNYGGIGWGLECEAWKTRDYWNPLTREAQLDQILYHYGEGNYSVAFDLNSVKQTVLDASDAAGNRRPVCNLTCLLWDPDPLSNGERNLEGLWGAATTDLGANEGMKKIIEDYVPGGVEYGAALVAAAWMHTWDLLGSSSIYYVKPAASGTGSCSSWENACTLQSALGRAFKSEIWVTAGTYKPTNDPTNRNVTFRLTAGVSVYGGFDGTETARSQRTPATNLTILSGDIDNNDLNTDGNFIAETSADIRGNNSTHVVTGAGGAKLDGFTITAGQANGSDCLNSGCGGGMYNFYSSPSVTNVAFSGNTATEGGGMYNFYSSPSVTNVTFTGNRATFGGGMSNYSSSPSVTNVTFIGNSAINAGGAIYNVYESPQLTNVTIYGNSAGSAGGGMVNHSFVSVRNSIFWGNTAPRDSQIYVYGSGAATVMNSVVQGNCPWSLLITCSNISIADPLFDAFGYYGGSTQTIPLLVGSSAIDAGNPTYCTSGSDQRGVPYMGPCDLGAYEVFAGRYYVKPAASGAGNCMSWADACTLQAALGAAGRGSEFWVMQGVYKPTTGSDRTATFLLADGLAVYGGFDGTETARAQRDPAAHVSILSGDIDNDDSQKPIITDLTTVTGNTTNAYHVVYFTGRAGATLDGFTITAGNASGNDCLNSGCGGGMYSEVPVPEPLSFYASSRITNVTFTGNRATFGGGMYVNHTYDQFTNVTFNSNTATLDGGGIYTEGGSPVLTNVTITSNTAGGDGGGMYIDESSVTGNHVTLSANSAARGGGLYNTHANGSFRNTLLWGNTAASSSQAINDREGLSIYDGGILSISDSIVQGGCPADYFFRCPDVISTDPRLGPLGNHGGVTQTIPLQPGSSAINAANATYCPTTDQRGVTRPQGSGCDIGAYEGEPTTLSLTSFTRWTPINSATNADILIFRATFNKAVHNVNAADFLVNGSTATITDIAVVSDTAYDITVSGGNLPDLDGIVGLDLAPTQDIIDMAEYALPTSEPATDETYAVNNTSILLMSFSRQDPNRSATNADNLVFRATFSSGVGNVDPVSAFIVTGTTATITQTTAISASIYDITVAGGDLAGLNGTVGIDLAFGTDMRGLDDRPLLFAEPVIDETYLVDNTPPLLASFTRQDPSASLTDADLLVFRAIFNEDMDNMHETDFAVSGTTASITGIAPVSTGIHDLTVAGGDLASFNGQVNLSLAGEQKLTDLAGNPLPTVEPATNQAYTLDNAAPTIMITGPDSLPEQSKTITASVSDGTLTMSNTLGFICDGSLTFSAYTDQTFTSEADNGTRICYRAVDALGNTSYSLSDPITNIDTTSLGLVQDGGVVGEPGTLDLFDNQSYEWHFTSIAVTFDADAYDPPDTLPLDPEDVTNPANYLLLQAGPDGEYDTASCQAFAENGSLPMDDDLLIPTGPVSYRNTNGFVATVTLNGGIPLPSGLYRLLLCGSTSIVDLAGNPLNNGVDVVLNFTIADPITAAALPATGFAPDQVMALPPQTVSYTQSDLWLEIPKLGIQMDIVGVPVVNGEWDVTWLGQDAGWLEGSAFPTWAGNSVLTGHVWNADNTAGPFRYINTLWYGDQVIIHAWGADYVYAVRSVQQVGPGSTAQMLKHGELPWVTLVTCRGYDPVTGQYQYRVLVRAVLIEVK